MTPGKTVVVTTSRLSIFGRPNVEEGSVSRQAIAGDRLLVQAKVKDELPEVGDIWCHVVAQKDGYEGFVERAYLSEHLVTATHWVSAREAPINPRPEVKYGPSTGVLFMGSAVEVTEWSEDGAWARVQVEKSKPQGWVFGRHLRRLDDLGTDPVNIARSFLGSPYVWGGNTGRGIDCSGLVQAALLACGVSCPGDSGPQHDAFVEPDRDGPFEAGELLFWKGHVAMATGPDTMIHATAYTMSVVEEPIEPALKRISEQGDAPWRGRGRPR